MVIELSVFPEKPLVNARGYHGFPVNEEIGEGVKANPLKYEALLPNYVGQLIAENECSVHVLTSEDSWFGVTYREDKPVVVEKFAKFKEDGLYPEDLWR